MSDVVIQNGTSVAVAGVAQRFARPAFGGAGRHDGRRQVVDRPPARDPARHSVRRCRRRDREGRGHDDLGNLRGPWRAIFPRRRDARDRPAARRRAAGAGDRRRRVHERGDPRSDPRKGHLGLAEGRRSTCCTRRIKRRGDRPLLKNADPLGDAEAADGRALSGLCRGRSDGGVARRAARNDRRRDHRRLARLASRPTAPAESLRHDRALRTGDPITVNVALGDARL